MFKKEEQKVLPTLLLIDDDLNFASLLAKHLRTKPCEVIVCGNTKEGKEIIKNRRPSIILLDVLMPDQYGVGFIDIIRSIDETVPIIMISGYGDTQIVVDALKRGACDYIQKPVNHEELWEKITRYVRNANFGTLAAEFK